MKGIWRLAALVVTLTGLMAAAPEASFDRTSYLTFNRSVVLPGVTLAPGTYIFETGVAIDPSVVRVLSRDRSKVFFAAFTNIVARPREVTSNQHVALGEAPGGETVPIRVWYPVGDRTGREFIYGE